MLLAAPLPDDPALTEACGTDPGAVCQAVWERTESEVWAKVSDWAIGRPLSILLILVIAWLASWIARRAVRRAVRRVVAADRDVAARALQRVGVTSGPVAIVDPRRDARATSISVVVASTVTVAIWAIAAILILGELGINLAPLIAGAGIAGIALGFGAQSLVKDCIAGVFMLIEDQYGIGDSVDLGQAAGVVERITLRTTVLRGQDGTVWHVPNGEIRRVGNRSQLWSVAVLDVVVVYDADLDVTRRAIMEAATEVCSSDAFAGDVLEAPELLGVEALSADGVTVRLLVKTSPGSQFRLQRALREAIKAALQRSGIDVPVAPPPSSPEPPKP